MVVLLPIGVFLVLQVGGDGAFGQDAEAVADDEVLGAQGDAGVIHDVAAVLEEGNAGDAGGNGVALQDAQDAGTLGVGFLRVGEETVGQGDLLLDGGDGRIIGALDLFYGVGSLDGLKTGLVCGVGGSPLAADLALDGIPEVVQVMGGVGLEVVPIDVSAVPGDLGLGLFGGFGSGFGRRFRRLGGLRCFGGGGCRRGFGLNGLHGIVAAGKQRQHQQSTQQKRDEFLAVHHFSSSIILYPGTDL